MTNAELAAKLNVDLGLAGADAVTVDIIRQWVLWDVLPKATVTGRAKGDWIRDPRSLKRARRLAKLRKFGIKSQTALIAQAYFEWGCGDFSEVKTSVLREFKRGGAKVRKRISSEMQFDSYGDLSATRKRALRHQGGPLDDRLRQTRFALDGEGYALALSLTTTGTGPANRFQELIGESLTGFDPLISEVRTNLLAAQFSASMTGLLGDPQEIEGSGVQTIADADERDFRIARVQLNRMSRVFKPEFNWSLVETHAPALSEIRIAAEEIGPQITVGYWAISGFVSLLQSRRNQSINPLIPCTETRRLV